MKNTMLSLNQGNFAKFCMAVSFTLADLKFLVQQSFSLTLYSLRPTLAKVNKIYESFASSLFLFAVSLFLLSRGYFLCRHIISFALTIVGHRTPYNCLKHICKILQNPKYRKLKRKKSYEWLIF